MVDEKTPWKKISRKELYENYPYLRNLTLNDMLILVGMCFQMNSDPDLIYYIKCYMHSYPELATEENLNKIFNEV